MKIECIKEKLVKAVSQAERVSGKNTTLPVLGCVLFEVGKGGVVIKSTNLDLGIEISIPTKVVRDGKAAIPSGVLNSFLSTIQQDDKGIVLETVENNTVKISTSKTSTTIKTLPFEDFPTIPKVSGENTFKIAANDIVRGLKSVWYSSSISSVKPELSSVFIHSEGDTLVFAATDSFRLAEKRVSVKKPKNIEKILIPFKNIPEIIRTLDGAGDVDVCFTKNQISISYEGVYLTSRVVDGVFPDYKQIIPKSSLTEATILKQDLVQTLKTANIFSDKFNQVNIRVNPKSKTLIVKTSNNDVGESVNSIDGKFSGEDVVVNFNHKYLSDCFQSIDADSVLLSFNGLNKPLVIRGVGDKSFLYLVMPMNK